MYNYCGELCIINHYIIKTFLKERNIALDCTLGNGHDTDFLKDNFKKVYSFDIQKCAVDAYKDKNYENVNVILDSHSNIDKYINESIDCVMYNLGFLPGGNKEITTLGETSLESIKKALDLLNEGGLITIALYSGHNEGKKEKYLLYDFFKTLPKNKYGVMEHKYMNRSENAPSLIVIEKKNIGI